MKNEDIIRKIQSLLKLAKSEANLHEALEAAKKHKNLCLNTVLMKILV